MKDKTLKRVIRYLKPYGLMFALTALFSAATAVLSLYIPVLIGRMIDLMPAANQVGFDGIRRLAVTAACCAGAAALAQWACSVINNSIAFGVIRDMRKTAFDRLQELPLSYLDGRRSGETVSRMIGDVDTFSDGLLLGFANLFSGGVTILCTLGFMIAIQPWIALAVGVLTPMSMFVSKFIASKSFSLFTAQSDARAAEAALADETISNLKVIKAFGSEKNSEEKFAAADAVLEKTSLKASFFSSLTNPSTRFVNAIVYAAVALSGALLCIASADGEAAFTVGSLAALLAYAGRYAKPFNEISGVISEFQNALACAGRFFELTDAEPQTPDSADAKVLEHAKGELELADVCFSYSPSRRLIEHLNLSVSSGSVVAIVGPTGCGKTTLINLLMRFYDVREGSIALDGSDIRDITRKSLRANYGMVLQETWLRAGTIRDNIRFGRPDATDAETEAAAKQAYAHGFIRRLPNGYDTVIGEDGGMLSQGQKQLLCIARVMLTLPPMLILDEATSSIDARTELCIRSAFDKMMRGRTSFIVAHRLSTVRNADIILVMRDGNIVESGKYDELIAADGFFAELYRNR